MAQLMDHVTYLSKEIGPRPAGTEEEQRAALYITEQFQNESGFATVMDDFSSSSNVEAGLGVMAGVAVVATLLSMIFPVLAIPAFILATAAAVVYSLEELDRPIISRVLSRGASQNVIAKYQPSSDEGQAVRASQRKIILMAHYDTGNVTPGVIARLEGGKLPLALICVGGMAASAFLLLIRIFVTGGGGMGLLVLNVLSIVAMIVCLYPIVKAVLIRTAPYNEGATNNATGTAALIELAHRVSTGSVSEAELSEASDGVVIHGEAEARAAGLVPDGVSIVYEAGVQVGSPEVSANVGGRSDVEPDEEDYDEEERLLSAKAAIAALTGVPVERRVFASIPKREKADEEIVEGDMSAEGDFVPPDSGQSDWGSWSRGGDSGGQYASYGSYDSMDNDGGEADGFENAPSWFIVAQQNARKADDASDKEPQIKRSRYTEAITNAERGFAEREEQLRAERQAAREAAQKEREEEFRALMAAREAERAGGQTQQQIADAPGSGGFVPLPSYGDASGATAPGQVPADSLPPDSTIAMPAPTPSSEIIAEALALEQAEANGVSSHDHDVRAFDAGTQNVSPSVASDPAPTPVEAAPGKIALPSIDPANPYELASSEASSQPQPKLGNLPSISTDEAQPASAASGEARPSVTGDPSRSGILRKLRTSIPSLSGLISPASDESKERPSRRRTDSVDYNMEVSLDMEAPSSNEQVRGVNAVEIPRSRSGNLMNRLRRDDPEALADTPQQWLDVQSDFNPREAGRERGGWESFRDEGLAAEGARGTHNEGGNGASADNSQGAAQAASAVPQRRWEGGAYSRVQVGYVDPRSGEGSDADKPLAEEQISMADEVPIADEIEQIYHFRNPQFNNEIWFVAVGADGMSHDGARAFIDEHRSELRGALIIEVESLGAGSLAVASEEGRVRKAVASSRAKRFTREATAATGLAVDSVSLAGTDSIASTLQKAGYQAMHIFGAEGGRPALKGSADDVVENVDEVALEEHVNYVYELLKR